MTGDIAFLAHRIPYPPDRGDKMRSFHLLRRLAELARVHLVAFADDDADLAHAEALRPLVGRLHIEKRVRRTPAAALAALVRGTPVSVEAFASATMQGAVDAILAEEPVDTVFAFSGQMAQFVPTGSRRFVMDFVDVDSAKFADYARAVRGPLGWLHAREARRLAAFEHAVATRASKSLFVSAAEAELFSRDSGLRRDSVAVLENGIDLAHYAPDAGFAPLPPERRGAGPLIVFTGQMDYRPNVAAALDFADRALPAIRASHPEARFAVVGRKPAAALRRIDGRDGVVVTGAVPDVRSWIAAADIVAAPLGIARGVQNKVLEGMAMARPVVATPAAFEGIDARPGRDLVVAAFDVMASEIVALIDDAARADALGAAGRRLVERRYGWERNLAPLAGIVGRAATPAVGAAA